MTATVIGVRLEHQNSPTPIGRARPRVSWRANTAEPSWRQSAYEISFNNQLGRQSTGKITSRDQVLIDWPFFDLKSRESGELTVRIWDSADSPTEWSEPCRVEASLLSPEDWAAKLIGTPWAEVATGDNPATYFRRAFTLGHSPVRRARLYSTAHGVYQVRINGGVVGVETMAPGWTSYDKELSFATHDVASMLSEGENILAVVVGDGWFRGRLGWGVGRRDIYGSRLGAVIQLEVEFQDGTMARISSDHDWSASTGGIMKSSLYDGETFDARRESFGWDRPGFDASSWHGVHVADLPSARLVSPVAPAIVAVEELSPVVSQRRTGTWLLDFGRIITGRLRLSIDAPAGSRIVLRHAEILEHGELCVRPLRTAQATDVYIHSGDGSHVWEPVFTLHGFRYAEVSGWVGELNSADVSAIVYRSEMDRTGWFECSDSDVNTLHRNVVNSIAGNFVGIPADCAQRDERLGWTGDTSIIAPTAMFVFDTAAFFDSWLHNLSIDQRPNGSVPMVVPSIPLDAFPGDYPVIAWGDAASIVPDLMHKRFGDVGVLHRQAPSMRAWARATAQSALTHSGADPGGFQFGDWLDPTAPPEHPEDTGTDIDLLAVLYASYACQTVVETLGRYGDEAEFAQLLAQLTSLLTKRFVTEDGLLVSDSQTAYSVALAFGLLDPVRKAGARKRLAWVVERDRRRLRTGFLGASTITDALTDAGRTDLAYDLLLRRDIPSWLYPVTQGATTIWERWDSLLQDGSVNPGDMTSFSHFSLGAIADWLHRTVAGLSAAEPGYRVLSIAPVPGGGLRFAKAAHQTPYGLASVEWEIAENEFVMTVVVPPNAEADVRLPGSTEVQRISSGTHTLRSLV